MSRQPSQRVSIRVVGIHPCPNGFTITFVHIRGGGERTAILPLPLPAGEEHLRKRGDECAITLIQGQLIVEVGA